jgi:hypothetical protein
MSDENVKFLIESLLGILRERSISNEELLHFDEELRHLGVNVRELERQAKAQQAFSANLLWPKPLELWRMYLRREELDRKLFSTPE